MYGVSLSDICLEHHWLLVKCTQSPFVWWLSILTFDIELLIEYHKTAFCVEFCKNTKRGQYVYFIRYYLCWNSTEILQQNH